MKLLLKTLDNKLVEVDATEDAPVRDIVESIKEQWGKENTYKLIYAGKVLKEGNVLSEYRVTGTLPIIVLVTKPIITKKKCNNLKSSKYTSIKPENDETALKIRSRHYALARQTKQNYTNCDVTDSDFASTLQLIMKCNYLFQEDVGKISREEMIIAVHRKFKDDDPEEAPVKEMILNKLEEVLSAGPNEAQFNAFLTLGYCWCQTFEPKREN